MRSKLFTFILLFFFLLGTHTSYIFALTIDTIGSSVTTDGNPGSDWYYTAENPIMGGTATVNSTVTITIDGTADTVVANANGDWTYVPKTLTSGDHNVSITADGQTISFVMHIGQTFEGDATTPATTTKGGVATDGAQLPVTGALENTLMLMGGGIVLMVGGFILSKQMA